MVKINLGGFMKKLKIYTFIIVILLVISIFPNTVLANNIETLNIEATIQEDGAIIIRDHRVFNVDSGTEHYISLGNLADSKLLYAKVFEGSKEYEFVENWDIDCSREEKETKLEYIKIRKILKYPLVSVITVQRM